MLNISQVILMGTDSNLCRKELMVHWSAPNSLIRSYLQPCTNSTWGDESEAVAPIIWLYQIVDAQKEEVCFPELLITLRSYAALISVRYGASVVLWVQSLTYAYVHSKICTHNNKPVTKIQQCTSPITFPYPTMPNLVTEMCTCVNISVAKQFIVEYLSDALWDLLDGTISLMYMWTIFCNWVMLVIWY